MNNIEKPLLTIITTTGNNLCDLVFYMADYIERRYPPHVPYEHIIIDSNSNESIRKSLDKLNNDKRKVIHFDKDEWFNVNFKKVYDQIQGDIIMNIDTDVFVTNRELWKFIIDTLTENPLALIGGYPSNAWIGKYKKGNIVGGLILAWTKKAMKSGIFPDQNMVGFGPHDVDLSLQFIEKGYPLVIVPKKYFIHLGGTISGFFYAIKPDYFAENSQKNHDYFFKKWDKKILAGELKGWPNE